jgi:FkbM family methyltransferase
LLRIIFGRIAFELARGGITLGVPAHYGTIPFIARSTNSQFHSIYFPDFSYCFEPDVFSAIDCFLPPGGVFIDVGSNWGHHTFIAAKEKDASVYAFEPNASVFRDLKSVSAQLGCTGQVTAFNLALGKTQSRLELVQNDFESGIATVSRTFDRFLFLSKRWPEKFLNRVTFKTAIRQSVDVLPLDEIIPADVNVDLIKIDAEGAELDCLLGMKATLVRCYPKVIFELHTDSRGSLESFENFFSVLGYRLYTIQPDLKAETCVFVPAHNLKPNTQYNLLASTELLLD